MAQKTRAKLKEELKATEEKRDELQAEVGRLMDDVGALQAQVELRDKELNSKDKELESQGKEIEDKDKEIEDKDKEIERKDDEITDLQFDLDNSLDKDTAEFFRDMILDMVEKAAKAIRPTEAPSGR
ncbi:hypothetical protein AMJ47_03515 [Parcubacteria bacterium DG_72]|nr:MAG: hypothetical protein AMJ47_03515 [Parcubacteria bacterium DG_72]